MYDPSLEELAQTIHNMKKHHHIELLRMIKKSNNSITISENSNGSFINMNEFDDELLSKIKNYVTYNETQESELYNHENIKNTIIEDLNQ